MQKKAPNFSQSEEIWGIKFAPQMYKNILFELNSSLRDERFFSTDLGRLYKAIPFDSLSAQVPPTAHALSGLGRKPWMDVKGGIGLQFLKHFLQLSDAKLIERLNTDWAMQVFCGILLKPGEAITDKDLPSQWRSYLGQYIAINKWQKAFSMRLLKYMNQTQTSFQDATCYESRITYPTDIKLIWKGCNTIHLMIQDLRKKHDIRKSRNNYDDRKKDYLSYQKSKKKTRRNEKKLRQKLLKYLHRLLEMLYALLDKLNITLPENKQKVLQTIVTMYDQQFRRLYGEKIEERIVSISKPYIRPIVRGKEVKPVEFGAKVNKIQVDGINFIEHLSYDAFNEGIRLEDGIRLHEDLIGPCKQISADAIYATNDNRKYCRL